MSRASVAPTLLVLDDDTEVGELIGDLAMQAGYRATVTQDAKTFNEELGRATPDLIVLDLQMPGIDGVQILRDVAASGLRSGILIVSGMDSRTIVGAERFARESGLDIVGTLQKPFEPEALVQKLASVRSVARRLTAADLATAVEQGELTLYYQPVVRRLRSGVWHGESVEALVRWEHASLGTLAPAQFLGLIESDRGALMQQLTDYVFELGIQQLQVWQSAGHHIGLRVNVAAGLIADSRFPDRLEAVLGEHDADPELLTLEINDPDVFNESSKGYEILTRLRLKSINLSLDDFGAAKSSLNVLYKLPFGEIKIVRSLVADAGSDGGAAPLVGGIISMAHRMDMSCCAVGVETTEQLKMLDDAGCDRAQGFLVGPPVTAAALPEVLADWSAGATSDVSG